MEYQEEKLIKAWIEYAIKEETNRIESERREKMETFIWFLPVFLLGVSAGCLIAKIITH